MGNNIRKVGDQNAGSEIINVYTDGSLTYSDFPEDENKCWGSEPRITTESGAGLTLMEIYSMLLIQHWKLHL